VCTVYNDDALSYGASLIYLCGQSVNQPTNTNNVSLAINMTAGDCDCEGEGLVSCISVIGDGCGVSISDGCAMVTT